jgi:nitrogen-specific signal transduction histidine kinase
MTTSKRDATASWLETSDAVLRGLNHEFSNRLSLARLAPQLNAMLKVGEPALQKLVNDSDQSEDLLQLLRLYRLMPFTNGDPAEPVLFSDAVPEAIELFQYHTSFRDIDVHVRADDSIPPTLMNPAALRQCVLLLLGAAARQTATESRDGAAIVVEFSANADMVNVTARVREADDGEPVVDPLELPALSHLIREVGGAVNVTRSGATMSVGTLVRLRRLEKQG